LGNALENPEGKTSRERKFYYYDLREKKMEITTRDTRTNAPPLIDFLLSLWDVFPPLLQYFSPFFSFSLSLSLSSLMKKYKCVYFPRFRFCLFMRNLFSEFRYNGLD
jgi:hypothetical protein